MNVGMKYFILLLGVGIVSHGDMSSPQPPYVTMYVTGTTHCIY